MAIEIKGRVLASWSCSSPTGVLYRADEYQRRKNGPCGEVSVVRVYFSTDSGESWRELPLKLALLTRITTGLPATWPPEDLDRFYFQDQRLCMEYRDQWVPYEAPILQFCAESLWKAWYRAKSRKWVLQRLRYLDYEGGLDKP